MVVSLPHTQICVQMKLKSRTGVESWAQGWLWGNCSGNPKHTKKKSATECSSVDGNLQRTKHQQNPLTKKTQTHQGETNKNRRGLCLQEQIKEEKKKRPWWVKAKFQDLRSILQISMLLKTKCFLLNVSKVYPKKSKRHFLVNNTFLFFFPTSNHCP